MQLACLLQLFPVSSFVAGKCLFILLAAVLDVRNPCSFYLTLLPFLASSFIAGDSRIRIQRDRRRDACRTARIRQVSLTLWR
ncbi:hypothetical protein V8F33_003486 [Rhypophila sp. PSN 637]